MRPPGMLSKGVRCTELPTAGEEGGVIRLQSNGGNRRDCYDLISCLVRYKLNGIILLLCSAMKGKIKTECKATGRGAVLRTCEESGESSFCWAT
jgi:hypothetical protein